MNADETEIIELLRNYPKTYVSVLEISKRLIHRHRRDDDRHWARPILRRMEMDGVVESNLSGEYRLKIKDGHTTSFLRALDSPGATLGDTTIICLDDVAELEGEPVPK